MNHILGLFTHPQREWLKIGKDNDSIIKHYLGFIIIIALIPVVGWYYGLTQIGWTLGDHLIKITEDSALRVLALFYLAMLGGVGMLGFMVHWMADTYKAETTYAKGVGIAAYSCTPLFIAGACGFYPILWLDIILVTAAACYAVYLLYLGVPTVLDIPKERGYLFASAMIAVGLVMTVALMGATVILWSMGAMPVFV
ncbi:MAG: hypothetical protein ACI8WB_004814 [Phenylobacterium sp.]|jgi:hypothetical protein